MTGFDETVPMSDSPDRDESAAPEPGAEVDEPRPEHDSKNPELEDERDPDESA